jgi:hypothetical protein
MLVRSFKFGSYWIMLARNKINTGGQTHYRQTQSFMFTRWCTTDLDLREVIPLQLDAVARGGRRTRGAVLKQIQGMGTRRYVLSGDNDNEFRSRCE